MSSPKRNTRMSSPVQLLLVMSLGVVVLMMSEARDPARWTWLFGSDPNVVEQEQKSLVRVARWAWASRPITTS